MTVPRRTFLWQIGGLALLLVIFLGPGPLFDMHKVLGAPDTDMISQFAAWRAFAANSMRHFDLPLWNPFVYGGAPFVGGFQSALFYPPNLLFLVAPLTLSLNWLIYLHLWIAGVGMLLWAARRGYSPLVAFLCGFMLMLGGRLITHVYGGHLAQIMTMAWAPYIFVLIDEWFRRPDGRFILLGGVVAALQFLGGHIQYAYYITLSAGLYSLLRLFISRDWRRAWGLLAIYPLGFALAAIQFFPGLAAQSESVRSGGVSFEFASMFSFPPENLLTLIAPYFFGDMVSVAYWGRCYLWEMSLFFGTAGALLGLYGLFLKTPLLKRLDAIMVVILFIVALGAHTPLFRLLYTVFPGFDTFRCVAKFNYPASLFFILCAGAALDRLLREAAPRRAVALAGGLAALLCLAGSGFLFGSQGLPVIGSFIDWVQSTRESYLIPQAAADVSYRAATLDAARFSLLVGGLGLALSSLLVFFSARRWAVWALALLLCLEIGVAAGRIAIRSDLTNVLPQSLAEFVHKNAGDYRVLDLLQPDNGYFLGKPDVWGNDPGVLKRYAEFMTFTQGGNPRDASQYLAFRQGSPLLALTRLRYVFAPQGNGQLRVIEVPAPMRVFECLTDYRVVSSRDEAFAVMGAPGFDPRRQVVLESEPHPRPDPGEAGAEVRVISSLPDEVLVEVRTNRSALLLMTDNYSRDWQVNALPGSTQQTYDLLPADVAFRVIPLAQGLHRLQIVYAPPSVAYGAWVSFLVLASVIGAFVYLQRRAVS